MTKSKEYRLGDVVVWVGGENLITDFAVGVVIGFYTKDGGIEVFILQDSSEKKQGKHIFDSYITEDWYYECVKPYKEWKDE